MPTRSVLYESGHITVYYRVGLSTPSFAQKAYDPGASDTEIKIVNRSTRGRRISSAACCIPCDMNLPDRLMPTHHPLALPPSLYADTAVPPASTPALDADRTVSVAIIGGGFAGLSTALHLAERGADAVVLEAQDLQQDRKELGAIAQKVLHLFKTTPRSLLARDSIAILDGRPVWKQPIKPRISAPASRLGYPKIHEWQEGAATVRCQRSHQVGRSTTVSVDDGLAA